MVTEALYVFFGETGAILPGMTGKAPHSLAENGPLGGQYIAKIPLSKTIAKKFHGHFLLFQTRYQKLDRNWAWLAAKKMAANERIGPIHRLTMLYFSISKPKLCYELWKGLHVLAVCGSSLEPWTNISWRHRHHVMTSWACIILLSYFLSIVKYPFQG